MINVQTINYTRQPINQERYEQTIHSFLKKYDIVDNVEVELNFASPTRMRRLNREFRHKDYPTDVLSFPIWPNLDAIKAQPGHRSLGSIVICLSVAKKDATAEHQPLEEKIAFLIEHSLLHLMGFHHEGD